MLLFLVFFPPFLLIFATPLLPETEFLATFATDTSILSVGKDRKNQLIPHRYGKEKST